MINANYAMDTKKDLAALLILDEADRPLNFTPALLTKWGGQIGASYLVNSLAFNGWAARAASPITVRSTGGHIATCFRPLYAIAFIPLVLTALFVLGWTLLVVADSSFGEHKRLEKSYGGLSPYVDAVRPKDEKETLLAWQNDEKPKLAILTKEHSTHLLEDGSTTAMGHLTPRSPGS
jgi:hypothetical protein